MAAQAGLSLTLSQTPKTGFLVTSSFVRRHNRVNIHCLYYLLDGTKEVIKIHHDGRYVIESEINLQTKHKHILEYTCSYLKWLSMTLFRKHVLQLGPFVDKKLLSTCELTNCVGNSVA